MSDLKLKGPFAKRPSRWLAYRMAVVWFVLFVINSLLTSVVGALSGTDWYTMTGQQKFIVVCCIGMNCTGVIMAFISNAAKKMGVEMPVEETKKDP